MMEGWKEVTLGDLCKHHGGKIQTGPFGSQLHQSDYVAEGIPVVMPKDINQNGIDINSVARVNLENAERLSRHKLYEDNIIFPRRGEITKCAIIKKHQVGYLCGTGCLKITVPIKIINPLFFKYFLSKKETIDWLDGNAVGATMKNLSTGILEKLPVYFPPLPIQKKIAAVLSAYDDLIENNLRRIKLLEETAQITYEEWFVRLRFPNHETTPINQETGLPEGWGKKSLSHLGTYLNGYAFKPVDLGAVGMPVIKIKEIKAGVVADTPRNLGHTIPQKYLVNAGDILFSWSASLEVVIWKSEKGILNQHLFKVTPNEDIPRCFLYLSLKESLPIFNALTTGATMKHIKRGELDFVQINVPSPEILKMFKNVGEVMINEITNITLQNTRLREARDILLPRLMSGKLDIDSYTTALPLRIAA
jgi:type I restriction enzyme, S subunit